MRRIRWAMRALAVLAAAGAIVAFTVRLAMQARMAESEARAARDLAEAQVTQSELEQGRDVSLWVVQGILGHATSRQTEIYAHLQPGHAFHASMALLDFPLMPSMPPLKALPSPRAA